MIYEARNTNSQAHRKAQEMLNFLTLELSSEALSVGSIEYSRDGPYILINSVIYS